MRNRGGMVAFLAGFDGRADDRLVDETIAGLQPCGIGGLGQRKDQRVRLRPRRAFVTPAMNIALTLR